jgi:predicted dehydrogenase
MVPFQANRHHYTWHWWYNFGTGDTGNDGVHDIDIARWGLGVDNHPSVILAAGGKFGFDDDQQFPDTQYAVFEYGDGDTPGAKQQLVYEMRIWSPYRQEEYENGNAFYGAEGMLILGKSGGWKLFGPKNKLVEQASGSPDAPAHHRNFLDSLRSGARPNADIEIGHLSASLCHLANIATRVKRRIRFDPVAEQIAGDEEEANSLLGRTYRPGHWAVPSGV